MDLLFLEKVSGNNHVHDLISSFKDTMNSQIPENSFYIVVFEISIPSE